MKISEWGIRILNRLSTDWFQIAKTALAQLPKHEHQPFIKWLEANDDMLEIYEKSPGRALKLWNDSVARYELKS